MSPSMIERSSWEPYLKYGDRRFYKRKSIIFREKDDGLEGFYYVKKGIIKISSTVPTGQEQIIDIVSDETPFGEQVIDGEKYFSTATAIVDSVIYFFPYIFLESFLEEDENFRILFYQSLTEKLKTLSYHLVFNSLPSEKLLARTLLLLREKFYSDEFPFTQQELCRLTNLNRTTIYQIFKKWEGHVVSTEKRKITIHNIESLRKIAAL